MKLRFKVQGHVAVSPFAEAGQVQVLLECYYGTETYSSQPIIRALVDKRDLDLYPLGGDVIYSIHGRPPS